MEVDCGFAQDCVDLTLSRAEISDSADFGFIAVSTTKAALSDVTIERTGLNVPRNLVVAGVGARVAGKTNLGFATAGSMTVQRFRFAHNAVAGFSLLGDINHGEFAGVARLSSGTIESSPSGILLSRGVDPSSLLVDVTITATTALDFR
jgi:hypothetical protein